MPFVGRLHIPAFIFVRKREGFSDSEIEQVSMANTVFIPKGNWASVGETKWECLGGEPVIYNRKGQKIVFCKPKPYGEQGGGSA
jgi:hypothetical protein